MYTADSDNTNAYTNEFEINTDVPSEDLLVVDGCGGKSETTNPSVVSDRDSLGVSRHAASLIVKMRSSSSMTMTNISDVVN